jgi:KUP system potassium uptake protein
MSKQRQATATALTVGALGVVFGDIGTSPLYALQAIFGPTGQNLAITRLNVLGILSLVIWSVTLVVSVKYVCFIMHAHNSGEGGVLAQTALLRNAKLRKKQKLLFVLLGLFGVALFYGDSVITPAISVLSAVEGLNIITPDFRSVIVPATLIILTSLFWLQRYGTGLIGKLFGPIMLLWFAMIGAAGLYQVWQHPDILHALLPISAVHFINAHPLASFIAMGAVVLAITGAEALYADMGHFGRKPISRAWFIFVFPALALCYLGQGVVLLQNPNATQGIFFHLFPVNLQLPAILIATIATVIASQSVISGAFSLTRQAIQLGLLPKLLIKHTSDRSEGQIFIPFVNLLLFVAVCLLVVGFGSSEHLANAYGIAVSGTLLADTLLFSAVLYFLWHKPRAVAIAFAAFFGTIDLIFVSSSITKVAHGGWIPLLIAACVLVVIHTWIYGQKIVSRKRHFQEGKLADFIEDIHSAKRKIARIPGQAVYIGHHPSFAPQAFRTTVEELHELHEKVVIVFVETLPIAHVPQDKRAVFNGLKYNDGISELRLSYGFHDLPNIPRDLELSRHLSSELDFNPKHASYFISLTKVLPHKRPAFLTGWRDTLYCLLANNSQSRTDFYHLPINQTVEFRSLIEL